METVLGWLEPPFGDFILAMMQSPLVRWGVALFVSLWVWIVGDEEALGRRFFMIFPFLVAALFEVIDLFFFGASGGRNGGGVGNGWFPTYLIAMEVLRRCLSPLGAVVFGVAFLIGTKRGFGFVWVLSLLLSAYFADQLGQEGGKRGFFTWDILQQVIGLLPAVSFLLLFFYGLGASVSHLTTRRNVY